MTSSFFRNMTIKRKLNLIIMMTSVSALILACAAIIVHQVINRRAEMVRSLQTHASIAGNGCAFALSFDDPEDAELVLSRLKAETHVEYASIYRPNGDLFAEYYRDTSPQSLNRTIYRKEGHEFAREYLVLFQPIVFNGEIIGTICIQSDLEELYGFLKRSVIVLMITMIIASFIAYLLSSRLQRIISAPISHLAATARMISEGEDYNVRANKEGEDELGQLTDAFNDMLGQIQQRDKDLRSERDWSTGIVRGSPAIICGIAADGSTNFINPAGERITGYSSEELVGQNWWKLFYPDDKYEKVKKLFENFQKGDLKDFEMILTNRSGEKRVISWNSLNVHDDNGELVEVIGFGNDITERRKATQEMDRLRNLLKNVVNSMPSVLVGVDLDGRVTQWNRQAEEETGIKENDAHGRTLEDVFPRLAEEMDNVGEAIRSKRSQESAKVQDYIDGKRRFSDITVYPLVSNDIEGAVIRVDDVTDQVRLEEMMIQSEKMMSVGGLAAGMAHEINNPLAGIIQNIQVMRNRMSGITPKDKRAAEECGTTIEAIKDFNEERGMFKMIEGIMESGRRAAKIVENMLNFSRKSESQFAPHKLSDLLDNTLELAENDYDLKKKYDFRQIEIVREYDSDAPEVPCEHTKIQQVILNLLKNGAHAMNEKFGGTREWNGTSGKPCFTLRVNRDEEMVCMEIEDNGAGMDEETCKRIFEPFFTTKEVGQGTGLGLSVSFFIIADNHHGTMNVESILGQGTKFSIRLPLERETQSPAEPLDMT